ncbi:MAG TPA: hypothetical protein VFW53_03035 [Gallionella sp.]|nr:hypothetical protein [Gallionella sp.]
MNNPLAVYQHPAMTVLIDDSQSLLDSLAFQLPPHLACETFTDPVAAAAWVRQAYQQSSSYPDGHIKVGYDEESDLLERRNAVIDLDPIYQMVSSPQRFGVPAVLVTDYSMPQMNGVRLCESLRDVPCKKILLTGQADDSVGIDAFNRNLIDCFIRKHDPDATTRLEIEIARLQQEFFLDQTRTLRELLSRHSFAFLTDPAIVALVGELRSRYRFVEYYLFPHPTGILFIDAYGKTTLLVLVTREGMTAQFEIAQDQNAPPELLSALRDCKLVPFFSDTGGMYRDSIGQDWLQYCLPAQICQGQQTYYWSLFELPGHFLHDAIYSYEDFLREHDGC